MKDSKLISMILNETLPEPVEKALRKGSGNSDVRISVAADIGKEGKFGERWLLVTDGDVLVYSPNGDKAHLEQKLSLSDIIEVKTHSLIGGSALEAMTTGANLVEIVQYSNVHATKFATLARWLDQRQIRYRGMGGGNRPGAKDLCHTYLARKPDDKCRQPDRNGYGGQSVRNPRPVKAGPPQ